MQNSDDCSYDSSGGAIVDGYCLYLISDEGNTVLECHCKKGYECRDPGGGARGMDDYTPGQVVKSVCKKKGSSKTDKGS